MRKDVDNWSLSVEKEDTGCALSRFLIAFDELRARLAPSRYPNIEISDEGHLWFNVDTSIGAIEVIALPFGFEAIEHPSILVSLPSKAEDVSPDFLKELHRIYNSNRRFKLFAGYSTNQEILFAYRQNEHPPLVHARSFGEIVEMKQHDAFFSYLGICFSVVGEIVSEVEQLIREILLKLEEKASISPE
ncbi:MAG: hypothetical protein PVF15_10635 [Candidatus Bathyarchaeota archaeon]